MSNIDLTAVGLFELAQAVKILYAYECELTDDNFVEVTCAEYEALERQGEDIRQKWYQLTRGLFEARNNPPTELPIVNKEQKQQLLQAVQLIYKMSDKSGQEFDTFRDRLTYVKPLLPPVITI